MPTTFDHTTLEQHVIFGSGAAVDHTVAAVHDLRAQRVLLIADEFAMEVADAVAARIHVVDRIHDVVQHVPAERSRWATARARSFRADAIVTIGGGSSTGLAKIVARDLSLPIIAVPTTFAGSEATNVWGITEAGRKTTGVDNKVLPKVIVYDASLSRGLPAQLAVSSGLNAIAHAVDGFWAPRADPVNKALGTEGLRALTSGLRTLHVDPDDLDGREQTLYGAYLAAVAFASAGPGMHHKICHALGGTFKLPHAETHSVVIGHVTAFNAPHAPDATERIIAAVGGSASAAESIFTLCDELQAPTSLRALGFNEKDIPEAARIILPTIPSSNPRRVTQTSLETILTAAWAGEEHE